jgi:hypothetical protein
MMRAPFGIDLDIRDGEEEESEVKCEEKREECHGRFQGAQQENGGEDEPALYKSLGYYAALGTIAVGVGTYKEIEGK